jgi:hypothetical protein
LTDENHAKPNQCGDCGNQADIFGLFKELRGGLGIRNDQLPDDTGPMTQIAYLLLCHKDPDEIIAQATRLTAVGDRVAIHFDGRSDLADYTRIRSALAGNRAVTFAARRIKCGWGEWSLVAATLAVARAAMEAFPGATHFYLLSGDCMPIKSAEYIRRRLEREDADFIESVDFLDGGWIKTGIKEERLIYRHWFNERKHKRLFYASMQLQARLGLARKVPEGLRMRIGSQWWCLRRRTLQAILSFVDRRPDVPRFFATTWIPDETFFQTLVGHLVPDAETRSRTLTFLLFTDYGIPATFYDDHHDLLLAQDFLFARKISPDAVRLKERLGALYAAGGLELDPEGGGRRQFEYLTARGRDGRRFAPRFWEAQSSIGRDRVLLVVVCKKWHVAKRLADRVRVVTGLPALDYVFNEEETALPDLGGLGTSLAKRSRHRRALLRMLFEAAACDRLLICVDPASTDIIEDVREDRAGVRLLEVECDFSDAYLAGHAQRLGLAGPRANEAALARLLPTIRHDLRVESERLRDLDRVEQFRLRQSAGVAENAAELARFLGVPLDKAQEIAATEYLFVD